MQLVRAILLWLFVAGTPLLTQGQENHPAVSGDAALHPANAAAAQAHDHAVGHGEHAEHHGLPAAAPRFQIGPFSVTNSMILTWIAAIAIIIFAQVATRNIKAIPEGAQTFWEWLVEGL